jgi:hypothetical protein
MAQAQVRLPYFRPRRLKFLYYDSSLASSPFETSLISQACLCGSRSISKTALPYQCLQF